MQYYLAPMEGITGFLFRKVQSEVFVPADKYFSPFIAPNRNRCMNTREMRDVLPEHNEGLWLIPQILTNRAEDFVRTVKELEQMGYSEVNLNLGCPSGTVVSKKRGAGFLSELKALDNFFQEVFTKTNLDISVKTRLGLEDPEEFYPILEIYNRYPIKELIIHPRVQRDFYKNSPHMEVFREAAKRSIHPVCYNGDLFTVEALAAFQEEYPDVENVMIGRGMLVNPGFLNRLRGEEVTKEQLKLFHDKILLAYQQELSGDTNLLFKMKELWFYMIRLFLDSEKIAKKIKKAQKLPEYQALVEQLFAEHDLYFPENLYF